MNTTERIEHNKRVLEAIRKGLYYDNGSIGIVATFMTDKDDRISETHQLIKMQRVIMAQLYDLSERLKKLEGKNMKEKEQTEEEQFIESEFPNYAE